MSGAGCSAVEARRKAERFAGGTVVGSARRAKSG